MAQNGSHHCEEGCLKTENPFQAAWASCPMSGFDPAAVRQLAGLPESHLPVLLVAVAAGGRGQSGGDSGAESAGAGRAAMAADLSSWK